jgi:hypothetical protein
MSVGNCRTKKRRRLIADNGSDLEIHIKSLSQYICCRMPRSMVSIIVRLLSKASLLRVNVNLPFWVKFIRHYLLGEIKIHVSNTTNFKIISAIGKWEDSVDYLFEDARKNVLSLKEIARRLTFFCTVLINYGTKFI